LEAIGGDMNINSSREESDERVEIKRSGSNVTWIFRNVQNESIKFDMSFMRADTIAALLKRSVNLGQTEEMKPRLLQGLQTDLYVYADHCAIIFDKNPQLRLVRSPEQVTNLIKDLEELAA
jgi:hypothetical protein